MLAFTNILASFDLCNVRGDQVIHLVCQGGLHHQLGEGGVPHCDGEVGGATHPVHDVTEGNGSQGLLNDKVSFYYISSTHSLAAFLPNHRVE